jgi:membrane-associated protease RseP (regulator of RpoE activity)
MIEPPVDLSATVMEAASDVMTVEGVFMGEAPPFRQGSPLTGTRVRSGSNGVGVKMRQAVAAPTPPPDPLIERAAVRLRGRLLVPSDQAYQRLAQRMRPLDLTPVLRKTENDGEAVLLALPGAIQQSRPNIALAATLFVLTALSCLFVGAQMTDAAAASGQLNLNLLDGAPYAVSLLAILLAHEFGHYVTARRLGAPVSLPYFIPLPIGLGTLGAVINMPAPPRDRRQLLSIGAAGPLAGLLVAIPVLWYGLHISQVQPLPAHGYQLEGNSILYALVKFLEFGRWLPSGGYDVFISPVAMAGWVGLLVTSLNLIPAGQLDGGHIFYALFGARWSQRVVWVILAVLAGLCFFYTGWLLWLGLIFLVSRLPHTTLDDITGLTSGQRVLAAGMLLVFILVFIPVPWTLVP